MSKLSHCLLGKRFATELCYKLVASNKVLVICNLPKLDPGVIKQSMEVNLRRKTKAIIDKFAVAENTAYITFCDSSGNWHVYHHFNVIIILPVCSTHNSLCVLVKYLCKNYTLLTIALEILIIIGYHHAVMLLDLLSCTASAIPLFLMQQY